MTTTIHSIGRRKQSTANVFIKAGTGKIQINKRPLTEYFSRETGQMIAQQPLKAVGQENALDITITVKGGGISGQAGAVSHAIARALVKFDQEFKKNLRQGGFLTRDARDVERKKVGLHKARKRPQYSKR